MTHLVHTPETLCKSYHTEEWWRNPRTTGSKEAERSLVQLPLHQYSNFISYWVPSYCHENQSLWRRSSWLLILGQGTMSYFILTLWSQYNTLFFFSFTFYISGSVFYSFWPLCSIWSSLGQGSDQVQVNSCDPHHSCNDTGSFNPLCQARDQTCIPVLQMSCQSHCTTAGTPV